MCIALSIVYSQIRCSVAARQHCNIVTQYCNIDRLIALANCNRHKQIASWNSQKICKQSLWLDYKKEGSTNPIAQTVWLASLFFKIQSEALFTNLLWISTCNLFVSVAICKSNQPINIAILRDNIAMLSAREHPILLYRYLKFWYTAYAISCNIDRESCV
jgi:hypothetical protein